MYFAKPYDLETYIENYGNGSNMLRGETFGQPKTLLPGDVLANDLELAEDTYDAGNGGVGLIFTDGSRRDVAARIPLLLQGGTSGKLPMELAVGDIFETGCVVLSAPNMYADDDPRFEQGRHETEVHITGGFNGHLVGVPTDLAIALHTETYPPSPETMLGAFVLDKTSKMHDGATANLSSIDE